MIGMHLPIAAMATVVLMSTIATSLPLGYHYPTTHESNYANPNAAYFPQTFMSAYDTMVNQVASDMTSGPVGTYRASATMPETVSHVDTMFYPVSPLARLPGWTGWVSWGGDIIFPPTCVSHAAGSDCACIQSGNTVWVQSQIGDSAPTQWVQLGTALADEGLSIAHQTSGELQVVARSKAGSVITFIRGVDGTWGPVQDLVVAVTGVPSIASWHENGAYIFITSTDRKVYKLERRHGRYWFNGWGVVGDTYFQSPPVAVSIKPSEAGGISDYVYVVAADEDGVVRYCEYYRGEPTLIWESLEMETVTRPNVSHRKNGFEVVVINPKGYLMLRSFTIGEGWGEWETLDHGVVARPSVAADGNGYVYVIISFPNQSVFYKRKTPTSPWGKWIKYLRPMMTDVVADFSGEQLNLFSVTLKHDMRQALCDVTKSTQ